MTAEFDTLRHIDRREVDRLFAYLARLDADGWIEQSYCAEWRVSQVVSHLASSARIFRASLAHWFDGAAPMSREEMQSIWDTHDALTPDQLLGAFEASNNDYLARLEALPSGAGDQKVESFLGLLPAQDMLALRLHELVLHSWDVRVARDRTARLADDAVDRLLAVQVQFRLMRTPAALSGKRVSLRTPDAAWWRLFDFSGEKPVLVSDGTADADLHVEAPAEELCRLLSGRHFLPGSVSKLTWDGGSYQDIVALNVFGS